MKNTFIHFCSCTVLFVSLVVPAFSQDTDDSGVQIENSISGSEESPEIPSAVYSLENLREHPLDLNTASAEDLSAIVFLTPIQVSNIRDHIQRHGILLSPEELQCIEGMNITTIRRILPYIRVRQPAFPVKGREKKTEHTFIFRTGKALSDSSGSPWNSLFRYRIYAGNKFSAGFTGAKETGSFFPWNGNSLKIDFNSFHLQLHDAGFLKSAVAGDYTLCFGQRLVLGSGFNAGKPVSILDVQRQGRGIIPYRSAGGGLFMHGAAACIRAGKTEVSLFYSHKRQGVTVVDYDSSTGKPLSFSSFEQGGYHGADTNSVLLSARGVHVESTACKLKMGATILDVQWDGNLTKNNIPYNYFYPPSGGLLSGGIDYSFLAGNFSFFGEEAVTDNRGKAFINGFLASLHKNVSVSFLHRSYSRSYHALFANGFRESSETTNENGAYWGIQLTPVQRWELSAYYDVFSFPWLRYAADFPSMGREYLVKARCVFSKTANAYIIFRSSVKEQNNSGGNRFLNRPGDISSDKIRFHFTQQLSPSFGYEGRAEEVLYRESGKPSSHGYMIYSGFRVKLNIVPVKISCRYTLFDTGGYDTRIYAYEEDVMYAYSLPFYYGSGRRYYLLASYAASENISIWIRFGQEVKISAAKTLSDLKLQVLWKIQ